MLANVGWSSWLTLYRGPQIRENCIALEVVPPNLSHLSVFVDA
jgi:hypothetical protein